MKGRRGGDPSSIFKESKIIEMELPKASVYEKHLLAIYLDTLYLITGERLSIFIKDIPFEASPTYNSILTRLGVIMPHLKISKEGQGKQISDILEKTLKGPFVK